MVNVQNNNIFLVASQEEPMDSELAVRHKKSQQSLAVALRSDKLMNEHLDKLAVQIGDSFAKQAINAKVQAQMHS